ncbi:hypothetical protein V6Z11_1Z009600 [Gossypium hirsutum]
MAGLQRSAVSFRRQGSSGIVGMTEQQGDTKQEEQAQVAQDNNNPEKLDASKDVKPTRNLPPINTIERSRSNGERRGYRTGKVSPAIEPPSPKVSACGFCSAFGKQPKNHRKKPGKRRSR